MRSAFVYNFLIEANIMASIAIILMIPLRKFFRKQLGNSAICFGWLLVAIRLLCPPDRSRCAFRTRSKVYPMFSGVQTTSRRMK